MGNLYPILETLSVFCMFSAVLEETKELQKLRKRQAGVSAEDLAAVENVKTEKKEEVGHMMLILS